GLADTNPMLRSWSRSISGALHRQHREVGDLNRQVVRHLLTDRERPREVRNVAVERDEAARAWNDEFTIRIDAARCVRAIGKSERPLQCFASAIELVKANVRLVLGIEQNREGRRAWSEQAGLEAACL